MTVIVGARCSDGIVVGTDSISTSANGRSPLIQVRSDDKIRVVRDKAIVVGTGSIGLAQRFEHLVGRAFDGGVFERCCHDCLCSVAAEVREDFGRSGVHFAPQGHGYGFGAMVAAPIAGEAELVEFNAFDLQPERKTSLRYWVSMGSGQALADPFLAFISRVFWNDRVPTVASATVGVCWALEHAIQHAPGGVGLPLRIAVLRREEGNWRARILTDDELQEPRQHISEIEGRITRYARDGMGSGSAPTSRPPAPPSIAYPVATQPNRG